MKKLLFIVNNRAGKTRSRSPLYDAIACFSRSGYLVSVHETQGPGDATQTVHDHGAQFDLIVCAGGDGTLNETITGLMTLEERPPLGYLPNGSTNDFAASLHIPANLVEAALIASDGTPTPLDLQNLIVAMTRQQYDYPGVIFRHVSNVTVTTEEDIPWSLDGEFAPSAPRVEIRNLPQAIQLML